MRGAGSPWEVKALGDLKCRYGGHWDGYRYGALEWRVRYGVFGRSGVTAMVMEVLLGVGGFDVDRGAEMTMVNMDIDIQESDMRGGSVPGEVDRILSTVH